jgi:hypothetical protein
MIIAHHPEDSRVMVMVLHKTLATDEDQRLVARHEGVQIVEVNRITMALAEVHGDIGMTRQTGVERGCRDRGQAKKWKSNECSCVL